MIKFDTWEKTNRIYKEIFSCSSMQPSRIKNTVENGVALVYKKKFS